MRDVFHARAYQHPAVLGNNPVEYSKLRENPAQFRHFTARDQEQAAAGFFPSLERRNGGFVHRAVPGNRAVIIRRQCCNPHESSTAAASNASSAAPSATALPRSFAGLTVSALLTSG